MENINLKFKEIDVMKIRILENVKTDLTEEEILLVLPEEVDPIGISEIKVKNYLVKYFFHKGEIVITEVKPLPEEVNQVLFNENELKELSDITLYLMYRKYYNQAFIDYIDGNGKAYIKHKNIANRINKEMLLRCDKEC